jgi:hypothetical protein
MAFRSRRKPGSNAPRPPNCFLLWRVAFCDHVTTNKLLTTDLRAQNISYLAGNTWRALTDAQKVPWQCLAQEIEGLWDELFPGYKYQPAKPKKPRQSRKELDPEKPGPLRLTKVAQAVDSKIGRRREASTAQSTPLSPLSPSTSAPTFVFWNHVSSISELSPLVEDESHEDVVRST